MNQIFIENIEKKVIEIFYLKKKKRIKQWIKSYLKILFLLWEIINKNGSIPKKVYKKRILIKKKEFRIGWKTIKVKKLFEKCIN